MKYLIFILFLFTSYFTISQEKFSKEISLITDNDLYVSTVKDRYYTSGFFLTYRYLSNYKKKSLEKRIIEWRIGQEMYTPYKSVINNILQHDRPFAGYLYGSFGINNIFKNKQILKTNIQLGVIGSYSYAKELQQFIHNIYGFDKAVGWEFQIKNALALNFNASFLKTIIETNKKQFDITWKSNLNFGTIYTNISTGFYSRIAIKPLQKITNSIAFNTNLNNKKTNYFREIESFIFIKSMLRYAFYDATLQGSFLNKSSLVTKELTPLVFDMELGLKCTINRLTLGYSFNYNTNKSKELRFSQGHQYGSITFNYLLH